MKITILILSIFILSCQKPEPNEIPAKVEIAVKKPKVVKEKVASPDEELSLKVLMKQLSVDMEGINNAIWAEDFPSISKSATAVSDHPNVGPLTKTKLVKILGKDMGLFAAGDKRVHEAAKRLGEAAQEKDMKRVLKELANLQNGCVGCHTAFRGRIMVSK